MTTVHAQIRAVERLARDQQGVVTRTQAVDLGVSLKAQRRQLVSGAWRLHLGTLLVPATPRHPDAADAAALQRRLGPHTLVTGPTALRLQGAELADRLLIAWCPPGTQPRISSSVRILRDDTTRLVNTERGLRLAATIDALLDTLITVDEARAGELLDRALQLRWITPEEWANAVTARLGRGRRGATRLRALTRRITEGTHSDGERRLARLLRRAGVTGWVANFLVLTADGVAKAELDFAFPDLRICIEVDGRAAHSGGRAFDRDRRRQNDLSLDGWLVLRFTWHQIVNEPEWVIGQIRLAIANRSRLAGIS
ncbi:MAG: DUF559 domain-containing protein [Actinomycetes bacterium]